MNVLSRAGIELMFNRLFQGWQRVNVTNAGLIEKLEYFLVRDAFVGNEFVEDVAEWQIVVVFKVVGKDCLLWRDNSDDELDVVGPADLVHVVQQSERDAHAFLDTRVGLIEPV